MIDIIALSWFSGSVFVLGMLAGWKVKDKLNARRQQRQLAAHRQYEAHQAKLLGPARGAAYRTPGHGDSIVATPPRLYEDMPLNVKPRDPAVRTFTCPGTGKQMLMYHHDACPKVGECLTDPRKPIHFPAEYIIRAREVRDRAAGEAVGQLANGASRVSINDLNHTMEAFQEQAKLFNRQSREVAAETAALLRKALPPPAEIDLAAPRPLNGSGQYEFDEKTCLPTSTAKRRR
jgi:hypothetical protein